MTFESEGLLIVAIYIWLPPASYVVFLTTLVLSDHRLIQIPVYKLNNFCPTSRFELFTSIAQTCVWISETNANVIQI